MCLFVLFSFLCDAMNMNCCLLVLSGLLCFGLSLFVVFFVCLFFFGGGSRFDGGEELGRVWDWGWIG